MAHDSSGHIFIQTVSGTTYGVEIADLQQVLGRGVNDLGLLCSDQEWDASQTPAVLADAKKINWWARKKPVPLSGSTPVWNHPTSTWYMGKDGNFGIYSKTYSTIDISTVLADLDGELNGWEYHKDALAYRLRDFEGYYHNARNPFLGLDVHVATPQVAPGDPLVVEYRFSGSTPSADYEISFDEVMCEGLTDALHPNGIAPIADLYLAILVYKVNGTAGYDRVGWATSDVPLSGLVGAARNVQFTMSTVGNYIVVPVFSEKQKETDAYPSVNAWSLIPGTNAMSFEVSTVMLPTMSCEAWVQVQNGVYDTTVHYRATFYAGTSGNTFRGVSIKFVDLDGQTVIQSVQNVQDPNGGSADLVLSANQTQRVPSSGYSTFVWNAGMTLQEYVEQRGGRIIIEGSGAASSETHIDTPAQPKNI